jgi:hypothetical protein
MREQTYNNNHNKWFEMESSMEDSLQNSMGQELDAVKKTIDELQITATAATGSWKIPFLILVVVVMIGAIFAYKKYQKLLKGHIL